MTRDGVPQVLPAIMGSLHQDSAQGELVLEQNDGCRRLYWQDGNLVFLQSDVAGEQFGNYLLRQGILDYPTLNDLLSSGESGRLGDRVVQWGLMTTKEREFHLASLQEQILIHAVEHPVLKATWNPTVIGADLAEDLQFRINHRLFVWNTFRQMQSLSDLVDLLYAESAWRWTSRRDLLERVSDLPLDPQSAFALSFLGVEPIGYQTFMSITGLDEGSASLLLVTLWALGAIDLTQGEAPKIHRLIPKPPSAFQPPPPVHVPPPVAPEPLPSPSPITPVVEHPPLPEPEPEPEPVIEILLEDSSPMIPAQRMPSLQPVLEPVPEPEDDKAMSQARAKRAFQKAKAFLLQERTVEAVRMLEQSVQLNPDEESAFEPWLLLGKLRMTNPAWSTRAIEGLQAASRIKPNSAEPWALMGELYSRKGFKANAHACFKRALDLDPSVPIAPDVDPRLEIPIESESSQTGFLGRFKNLFGG